jgi:L-rhamnose-H+ transport protein
MIGAACAASFYAPIGKVKRWSWETTWAVAGIFSWILLPVSASFLLLPDLRAFYWSINSSVLLKVAYHAHAAGASGLAGGKQCGAWEVESKEPSYTPMTAAIR